MRMAVTMTSAEVAEALRAWLSERGVPESVEVEIRGHWNMEWRKLDGNTVEVRFNVETQSMGGPYR